MNDDKLIGYWGWSSESIF